MTLNQKLQERFSVNELGTYQAKLYLQEIIDKNKHLYPNNKIKLTINNYEHTYFTHLQLDSVYKELKSLFSSTDFTLTSHTEIIKNKNLLKKFPHGERNHIFFNNENFRTSYFTTMLPETYLLSNSYSETLNEKSLFVETQGGGTFVTICEENKLDPFYLCLDENDLIEMIFIMDENNIKQEYDATKNKDIIDFLNSYGYLNLDNPEIKDLVSCLFDINLDFFQSENYAFFKKGMLKLISELETPTIPKKIKNSFK